MDFTAKELQLLFGAVCDMIDTLEDDVDDTVLRSEAHKRAVENLRVSNGLMKKLRKAMDESGIEPDFHIFADISVDTK